MHRKKTLQLREKAGKLTARARKRWYALLPALIFALLSTLSIHAFQTIRAGGTLGESGLSLPQLIGGMGAGHIALCAALAVLYFVIWILVPRAHFCSAVIGILLAGNMIVTLAMEHTDLQEIFLPGGVWVNLVLLAGFALLIASLMELIYLLFDRRVNRLQGGLGQEDGRGTERFLLAAFLIFLLWLPGRVMSYPGSIHNDTKNQIKSFLGLRYLTASDPALTTLFYGGLYQLGMNAQHSFNMAAAPQEKAIFLPILVQTLCNAAAMGFTAEKVYEYTRSRNWYRGTILFFGLTAIWQTGAELMLKDLLHTGAFLYFYCLYLKCLKQESISWKDALLLLLAAVLITFTRRAAYYIALIGLAVLLIMKFRTSFVKYAAVTAALAALFALSNSLLYPLIGIEPEWQSENYSLQFRQVALYCKTHREEMTEEEIAVVNGTLDFETIIAEYSPMISDGVKGTFHGTEEDHRAFWKLYGEMFRRDPGLFLRAVVMNSFEHRNPWLSNIGFFVYIEKNDGFITVDYARPEWASAIRDYWYSWPKIPVLRVLCTNGFYSWLLLMALGYALIRRSWKGFLGLIPSLAIFVGLFMSHVNGELRYGYPMNAATPLVLAWVIHAAACRGPAPEKEGKIGA